MDAIVAAFAEQHTELERLIEPLDPQGWARPAPDCAGWSLTDVVLHLAQADEWAMAGPTEGNTAAATRMAGGPAAPGETTDDIVGRMVAHERGAPPEKVLARWRESSTGSAPEFCLVAARRVESADTGLVATGPDGQAVLALVRTWA